MNIDKDIQSVQQARDLARAAKEAQLEFKHFSQEQVDKIIKAMADAGFAESERLAKLANEETGFGKWEDKLIKNQFGSRDVYESIKNLKSVGVIATEENGKLIRIAEPMGVVTALIPSTNPTSTAMFKSLISLKCRNGIVVSPHPSAVACTKEALKVMSDSAEKAGAPKGLIQCMTLPTLEGTEALMKDDNIAVILATGSTPMVKAAYSAGKPAYGVGSGNVPAFIERTADYKKAVTDIIRGTTFDNGTLCSSEQAMIVDRPLDKKVREEAIQQGSYFLNDDEKLKLEKVLTKGKRINAAIVGKSAKYIADLAGISVNENTTVLIAECKDVGWDEPLSMEKLSPILAYYVVDGWLEGCHKCIDLLNFGGIGHTLAIHSNDKEIIMKFALEKPAFRIVVNTPASLGAVGYTTGLLPSMTIGVGTWGGSIISENVSAKHLMNIKTLAFETKTINKGNSTQSYSSAQNSGFLDQIEERLRARAGNPKFETESKSASPIPLSEKVVMGDGISKDEVKKIVESFTKEF